MTLPIECEVDPRLQSCWDKLAVADRELGLYLYLSRGLEQVMKTRLDDRLLALERLWCEYTGKVGNNIKTPGPARSD